MADHSLCRDCRFFQKHVHMGVCKRFPLVHNKSETDWCGEWMPVEVKQEEPVKRLGRPPKVDK